MYRVLVVDDEKIEREGIKFLLSREEGEFEISEASNGRQALEILRNEEIDLLLTDIKMPHMDGLELAKNTKSRKDTLTISRLCESLMRLNLVGRMVHFSGFRKNCSTSVQHSL